ncbi:hypothetical protein BDR26DRAFT_848678 [Obelidium mucronatum]|nr:hypothetical protein BDR26DRAFT_848678 [Obelidium mucronatum]
MNRQKSNLGNGAVLGNPPPVLIHEKKRVGENSGGLSLGLGAPPPAPTPPPPPPPVVTRIIQEKRKRFDSEDDIVDYGDGDDDDSVQGSGNSYVIPSKIFQPSISSGSYKGVDMSLPVPKSRKFNEVIDLTGDHIDSGVGSSINNNGLNTAASSSSSSHKLPISERIGKKPAIMERLGGKKEDPFVIDSASPSPSRNLGSGGYVGSGSGSRGSPRHTQTNNANATAGTTAATATVAVATAMSSAPFVSSSSSATTTSSSRTSIFERLGGSHKPEFNESKGSEYSSSQIAERLGGGGGGGGSRGSGGRTGNSTSGSGGKLPPPPAVAAIPVYTRIIPQHNAAVPLSTLVSPPGYAIPQQQQQQQQHQDAFLQRYAYPQSSYFPTYPFGPGYGSGGGGGGGGSLNLGTVGSGGGGGGYSSSLSYPSSSGVLGRNSGRDNDQSRKDRSPNGAKGGDGSSSSSNSRDGNRGSVERRVEDGVIRRRF